MDGADGSGGTLNLVLNTKGLGSAGIQVFDDPAQTGGDEYFWTNNNGNFRWTWSGNQTDGNGRDRS